MNTVQYTTEDHRSGQALVVLLIFVTVSTMVALTATLLTAYTMTAASEAEQAQSALDISESAMENGLLRFLRDSAYVGETLTLGSSSATLVVTGSNPKTFTSIGTAGNFKHTVVVTATYTNGILTVTSWKDSY